jgi:hypothetical protein
MWLWNLILTLLKRKQTPVVLPTPVPVEKIPIPTPMPPVLTMREKIYDLAKSCLSKDIAATQNELGCAEAVSYILSKLNVQGFPKAGFLSTTQLNIWLKNNATSIEDRMEPLPGDIIISPTGMSTKGAAHGHVGIVGKYGIMSNNSMTGLFQQNYTLVQWDNYYAKKLGFPTLFYRVDN